MTKVHVAGVNCSCFSICKVLGGTIRTEKLQSSSAFLIFNKMKQPYVKLKLSVKLLLLCLCLLSGHQSALAYDAEIDGIYYNLNNDDLTASVTYKEYNYKSYSGDVTIPSSVTYKGNTYNVTSIENLAFSGCSKLSSITIGNNVTSIGHYAFSRCYELTSVTISNSVTSIEDYAFNECI